jgi:5-oxoprolinase (ATP-hydrolysing)
MTNSLITDSEVLEFRHPVVLETYEIRRGSGGVGRWTGGNGATRRIRFLAPMTASILSNNRRIAPFGMAGGMPGQIGRNWIERANGRTEELGSCATVELATDDVFVVETPGGGGYGC